MKLAVNGTEHALDGVNRDMPLLLVLRDRLGLKGTKFGCGVAACGICTVHADGLAIRSCTFPVSAAEGVQITTIEGVSGAIADAVRAAWLKHKLPECDSCRAGQIMSAVALLTANPLASRANIKEAVCDIYCRCGIHSRIAATILLASDSIKPKNAKRFWDYLIRR